MLWKRGCILGLQVCGLGLGACGLGVGVGGCGVGLGLGLGLGSCGLVNITASTSTSYCPQDIVSQLHMAQKNLRSSHTVSLRQLSVFLKFVLLQTKLCSATRAVSGQRY